MPSPTTTSIRPALLLTTAAVLLADATAADPLDEATDALLFALVAAADAAETLTELGSRAVMAAAEVATVAAEEVAPAAPTSDTTVPVGAAGEVALAARIATISVYPI